MPPALPWSPYTPDGEGYLGCLREMDGSVQARTVIAQAHNRGIVICREQAEAVSLSGPARARHRTSARP